MGTGVGVDGRKWGGKQTRRRTDDRGKVPDQKGWKIIRRGVFWRGWGEFQGFWGVQDGTREDGRKIFQTKKIKNRRDRV